MLATPKTPPPGRGPRLMPTPPPWRTPPFWIAVASIICSVTSLLVTTVALR